MGSLTHIVRNISFSIKREPNGRVNIIGIPKDISVTEMIQTLSLCSSSRYLLLRVVRPDDMREIRSPLTSYVRRE